MTKIQNNLDALKANTAAILPQIAPADPNSPTSTSPQMAYVLASLAGSLGKLQDGLNKSNQDKNVPCGFMAYAFDSKGMIEN